MRRNDRSRIPARPHRYTPANCSAETSNTRRFACSISPPRIIARFAECIRVIQLYSAGNCDNGVYAAAQRYYQHHRQATGFFRQIQHNCARRAQEHGNLVSTCRNLHHSPPPSSVFAGEKVVPAPSRKIDGSPRCAPHVKPAQSIDHPNIKFIMACLALAHHRNSPAQDAASSEALRQPQSSPDAAVSGRRFMRRRAYKTAQHALRSRPLHAARCSTGFCR